MRTSHHNRLLHKRGSAKAASELVLVDIHTNQEGMSVCAS